MRLVKAPLSMGSGKSVIMECGEWSAEWTGMGSNRKLYVILNCTFCRIICLSFFHTVFADNIHGGISEPCVRVQRRTKRAARGFLLNPLYYFMCHAFFSVQTNEKRETMWLSTQTNESLGTKKVDKMAWNEGNKGDSVYLNGIKINAVASQTFACF